MCEEYRQRLVCYRTTMSIVKKLLMDGIISKQEYRDIDTKMLKKYDINSSTLFS